MIAYVLPFDLRSHLSMNPLKQGLKHDVMPESLLMSAPHLSMNPLKQGLKLSSFQGFPASIAAFIHESIKTRVETCIAYQLAIVSGLHLSMNPLKQGLKLLITMITSTLLTAHLSMNPLKQGLKPRIR